MKITGFHIEINKERVLSFIDCYPDNPVYESVLGELLELLPTAYEKMELSAVFAFGPIVDGELAKEDEEIEEALYCIASAGREISKLATLYLEEGEYVKGVLANAIADDCLFQMDEALKEPIVKQCQERGVGVVRRLEAPCDIPIEAQKTAWEMTRAEEEIGLGIKESYMFDPVKTNCQIYLLKKGTTTYQTEHDCGSCPRTDCETRSCSQVTVTVKRGGEQWEIVGRKGQTLLEMLQSSRVYLNAVCAGRGTCGKCKVRFLQGATTPTKAEERFFDPAERKDGWRLACKAAPKQTCTVLLPEETEAGFVVVTEDASEARGDKTVSGYGIAVDIGTTTLAMQLVRDDGSVQDTYTAINRQRAYGADVISRIQASNEGKGPELRACILEDLKKGIEALLRNSPRKPERMVVGGNTTMIHLLMGYSCETLGIYPFAPVHTETLETDGRSLFGKETYDFQVIVIPGISAYVGGDVTAGLLACGMDKCEKPSLFLDLGTNGEMGIGCKEKMFVASTAAGPAFEGGNIVCGTGSVPGAIRSAIYERDGFCVKTIGNGTPKGICGTGVIDLTYELLKHGQMDKTGLLEEPYLEDGVFIAHGEGKEIRFYQQDVRELQLAKAAIRAGLETLLLSYGITYAELDAVYIAGGFGYEINVEKAIGIGLFPEEWKEKIKPIGNSALGGARHFLRDEGAKRRSEAMIGKVQEISLSLSSEFQELYMEHMHFPNTIYQDGSNEQKAKRYRDTKTE